jgi:hypothetical protein
MNIAEGKPASHRGDAIKNFKVLEAASLLLLIELE